MSRTNGLAIGRYSIGDGGYRGPHSSVCSLLRFPWPNNKNLFRCAVCSCRLHFPRLKVYLGNSAVFLELSETGGEITSAVLSDMPTALYVFLEHLPFAPVICLLATLLIVTFFVTSSDGSLVIDIITSGGNENPPVWQRIFWAISEGVVASVLLLAGRLGALQTAAISNSLPFSIVMIFICVGLYRALQVEVRSGGTVEVVRRLVSKSC